MFWSRVARVGRYGNASVCGPKAWPKFEFDAKSVGRRDFCRHAVSVSDIAKLSDSLLSIKSCRLLSR